MKNLTPLLLVVLLFLCSGQKDHCNRIKKNTDENGTTTFRSPDLKHIAALKQFKAEVYFGLVIHYSDVAQHFDTQGASIEFEDGTLLKDETIKIDCKQEAIEISSGFSSSSSLSNSGHYVIQCYFPITEENIALFLSKKIKRIILHNAPQNIPDKEATQIRSYLNCLKEMKP